MSKDIREDVVRRFRKIKSHTFRGNKYKIEVKKIVHDDYIYALTDGPKTKGKKITIDPRHKDGYDLMETMLDESIHACMWDINNDVVKDMAQGMAKFLWRAGFRLELIPEATT